MESGERLVSPSSASSSSAAPSSPAPSSKSGLTPGPTTLGSTLTTCGHLFRAGSDQTFNLSTVSSAFPMLSHPAFGLYTTSSGRSEFGGLGTLGVSAALAAHPQLGAFPEWWRSSETHGHGSAPFFPPLLGLPPMFAPQVQNHEPGPFQSRTPSTNGRSSSSKGVNGAVNGGGILASSRGSSTPAGTPTPAPALSERMKTPNSAGRVQKGSPDGGQAREKHGHKTKDKKLSKKGAESSSNSDSESASSSGTSSEGVSSSDSEDLGDDDEDDDEEDDDQSNDSEDSDSEKEAREKRKMKVLRRSPSEGKKEGPRSVEEELQDRKGSQPRVFPAEAPPPAHLPPQPAPLLFPGSKAQEESARQHHQSVIQAIGLAASSKPLALVTQPRREAPPNCHAPASMPLSLALSPSPKRAAPSPESVRTGGRHPLQEPLSHIADFRLKPPFLSPELKKQQELFKSQKTGATSRLSPPKPPLGGHKLAPLADKHSNLFLSNALLGQHRNGVIQTAVQEAPLALITKPRGQAGGPDRPLPPAPAPGAGFPSPVNLSTGAKAPPPPAVVSVVRARPSTSPGRGGSPGAPPNAAAAAVAMARALSQSHLAQSLVEMFRAAESDIPSSKDSDDSAEDEEEEEEEEEEEDSDEDSDDSPSESESNLESNSDGSEEDAKDCGAMETDAQGEDAPLKLVKTPSSSRSADCSPLNLIKTPSSAAPPGVGTGAAAYHSAPSSSFSLATPPGSGKRRRVTDERELRIPLELGWQRETRIRTLNGRVQGDVSYYAPCGKKLRQYPDIVKYLSRNGVSDITRDNFSFSAKIRVGDFYEARDGSQGLQWSLLKGEDVLPRILAMEGRRGGRPSASERQQQQQPGDGPRSRRRKGRPPNVGEADAPGANSAKLLRKLEAQEIARQAAQIKMMRKLEKQALARAAKEARKQQAIMAAEEKRKQKEQIKILKQQEKIKRIQQIRMEKELRAQQILEAKRKKKEEAANAKILEAEKRTKEKELRRQQAVMLKHQELERHRLDMVWERERRRQHMMLMKAMEARKKAEEKERLKQEKRDEKRLNKERRLELRRLELEIAKELKKPNEDMCLADHKPLPELSRMAGLVLPGSAFSDCLMLLQFLRSFGKVLGLDVGADVPTLGALQEGLLNAGESVGEVQDLLVRMLSAAVCDPGIPPGLRTKTALGDHLTNVGINRDNVSEILQIYMEAHCGRTELAAVAASLRTKAFQAHTPAQKASVLAFLVNELACSKSVVSEIDKNIDHMTNLRRDKWVIEGKLRKLRSIHAKKTGKRDSGVGGEETPALGTPASGRKRKRKAGDSDEDEDEDEDSDDQGEEDDDEEEEGKKGKKAETCEEEDEGDQTASVEELEKQIDKLTKQQNQIRRKLFEASHSLRSMMFGQDRYKRRYWVLPQCGGVFVEGMESGEGPEEVEKERERLRRAEELQIKEEPPEVVEEKPLEAGLELSFEGEPPEGGKEEEASPNLFLQKPDSFSKLSQLLEVAKLSPESEELGQKEDGSPRAPPTASPSPSGTALQAGLPGTPPPGPAQPCAEAKPDPAPSPSHLSSPAKRGSPHPLLPNDQLLRVLTEKSGHWFSLLPRSPCDDSSLTSGPAPRPASPRPCSSSSPAPPPASGSPGPHGAAGMGSFAFSAVQVKPGVHLMGIPFCGWPGGMVSPNLPFSSSPLPSMLGGGYPLLEGNASPFLAPSVSTSKSDSPAPSSEKPPSAPSPVLEVAKPQDYPDPRPIPEEMLTGWWKVSDMEELRSLVKALHCRGVREKALQKQMQKYIEYIAQASARNRDVSAIDPSEAEENQVTEETVAGWCVEEQAMEMDIAVLQQVEELERKVTSASLQVKGWIYPEPHSEREDLVYHEHKPSSEPRPAGGDREAGEGREEKDGGGGGRSGGGHAGGIVRRVNNPLDIAVTRLAELERNIERRYLKTPLGTTIQIRLDNVGTVTAPAPCSSADGEGGEEDLAPGMKVWRRALGEVRSGAQLALCIQQLQKSIAWERSIMKVYCQVCRKGDNEELLLLCDGCDKGCHTYCQRPKISTIPEGDWFCPACISKASAQSPKNKKLPNRSGGGGGGKKSADVKRNRKLSAAGEVSEDDAASASSTPKKGAKEAKKRKGEEAPAASQPKQDSPASAKKAKTARDTAKDLAACSVLLSEMEGHQDAWPFLTPVNLKSVPGYKKVIKKPMDFSTIREKLGSSQYQNLETFIADVNLVFDNCEKFNEDDSDIGQAGHGMRKFFERRQTELFKTN
ncbi:bromodomain adjacent to zinc finger domain protein 2B-like [Anguilla anguilla]|uniref:bromodomain adjacent to zinc finger domain protein 2B-like n=1 Tax=Anguilla anguilla TaxID=7936 RepID=UPI0015B08436|nr:bromodomain adjacent to zinc finger domain protein 2B-like [Anguilla anguilla]